MVLADQINSVAPCARVLLSYRLLPAQTSVRAAVPIVAEFTPAQLARVEAKVDRSALAIFASTVAGVDALLGKIDVGNALESDEITALHALRRVHPSLFLGADAPVPTSWGCHAGRVSVSGLSLLLSALPPPPITPLERWRELAGAVHYFVEIIHGRRPTPDELPPPFASLQGDGTRDKWVAGYCARYFGNPDAAPESFRSAAQVKIARTMLMVRQKLWRYNGGAIKVVDKLRDARRYFQKIPDPEAVRVLSSIIGALYCVAQRWMLIGHVGNEPDIEWLLEYPALAEKAFTSGQNTFGVEKARGLRAEVLEEPSVKSPRPRADRLREAAQIFEELGRPADRMRMFRLLARQMAHEGDMNAARAAAGTVAEIAQQLGDVEPAVLLREALSEWAWANALVTEHGTKEQQAAHYVRSAEKDPKLSPQGRASAYRSAAYLIGESDPKAAITYELTALRIDPTSSLQDYTRTIALLRAMAADVRAEWEAAITDEIVRQRVQRVFTTGQAWRTVEALLLEHDPLRAEQFLWAVQLVEAKLSALSEEGFAQELDRIKRAAMEHLTAVESWHALSIVAASLADEPDVVSEIVEGVLAFVSTEGDDPIRETVRQGVQELMLLGRYGNAARLVGVLARFRGQVLARSVQVERAGSLADFALYDVAADLLQSAVGLDPTWTPPAPEVAPASAAQSGV